MSNQQLTPEQQHIRRLGLLWQEFQVEQKQQLQLMAKCLSASSDACFHHWMQREFAKWKEKYEGGGR